MSGRWLWLVPVGCLALGMIGLRLAQPKEAPRGQQPPEDFHLPTYPGGYEFKSSAANPKSKSVAYLVKKGSADQVADFYRIALKSESYRVEADQHLQLGVPSAKKGAPARHAPARRMLFTNQTLNRVVMLTAIEQPVYGAHTQVVLAFGPLSGYLHPDADPAPTASAKPSASPPQPASERPAEGAQPVNAKTPKSEDAKGDGSKG